MISYVFLAFFLSGVRQVYGQRGFPFGLGMMLPFSPSSITSHYATPWPFTTPEPSASARIEDLLDRLPILFETQPTTYPTSVVLEASVSQAGASYCNGVM